MAEASEINKNKKWTDEERLKLAEKLDSELDDFIDGLERKPYEEGWPEDRWQEEIEKHPFFLQKSPEPGEEVSPLMEGLQQLKYGVDDNTPEELANNYKEDGNFNYKYKKYRLAILSYTEGIKTKCEDKEIMAQLYNNRAASSFMLKNYRSCLNDCKMALRLKEDYQKTSRRAIQCCLEIKEYDQCIERCDKHLEKWAEDKDAAKSKTQATMGKKLLLRNQRMQDMRVKKTEKAEDSLIKAIETRNIKLESTKEKHHLDLSDLEPQLPQIAQNRVHFDSSDKLIWPVIFMYPEVRQTDFIQNFHEDSVFLDQLEQLFEEPPAWDLNRNYSVDKINVYFEGERKKSVHKLNVNWTLQKILQDKRFFVRGGTPSFVILAAGSEAERHFLSNYRQS